MSKDKKEWKTRAKCAYVPPLIEVHNAAPCRPLASSPFGGDHLMGFDDTGGLADHLRGLDDSGGIADHLRGFDDRGGMADHLRGLDDYGGMAFHIRGSTDLW